VTPAEKRKWYTVHCASQYMARCALRTTDAMRCAICRKDLVDTILPADLAEYDAFVRRATHPEHQGEAA
jgi:hypothetical protein